MNRRLLRQLLDIALMVALVVTAAACSDNGASSVTSTPPTIGGIQEPPFTGTLTRNGAKSFSFSSTTSGSIIATLTTLTSSLPGPTPEVGLWLGVWDGTRCSSGVVNNSAVQSTIVSAFAPSSGTWCVRIYDPNGSVPIPQSPDFYTYQIDLTHP